MSGKTTSIRTLFRCLGQQGKIESIETSTGRTLFFDFGTLELNRDDWTIRIYIWSATGQDYYAETRSTVLSGTDGIVFVADSHPNLLDENIRSWTELQQYFGEKIGNELPVVIALNKRDLPDPISSRHLLAALPLNKGFRPVPTIATTWYNIKETFSAILQAVFHPLT